MSSSAAHISIIKKQQNSWAMFIFAHSLHASSQIQDGAFEFQPRAFAASGETFTLFNFPSLLYLLYGLDYLSCFLLGFKGSAFNHKIPCNHLLNYENSLPLEMSTFLSHSTFLLLLQACSKTIYDVILWGVGFNNIFYIFLYLSIPQLI